MIIKSLTTAKNVATYAGQYLCDGWVDNLEPVTVYRLPIRLPAKSALT